VVLPRLEARELVPLALQPQAERAQVVGEAVGALLELASRQTALTPDQTFTIGDRGRDHGAQLGEIWLHGAARDS